MDTLNQTLLIEILVHARNGVVWSQNVTNQEKMAKICEMCLTKKLSFNTLREICSR